MNEKNPQVASGSAAAAAALEARIDRIRQALAEQQARLARGSRLTAIIGGAVIVLLAVYFGAFFVYIQPQLTPKGIVAAAEAIVVDAIPEARKALESRINESADEWAADLSLQVQENIPGLRGRIEDLIMDESGKALDKLHVLTAQRFSKFINENRTMLADGFNSLRKPDEAEQFVNDLHGAIAQNMSGDIREQADDMLHSIYQLNHKLDLLKEGKNLKGEQPIEREILMIAKRLQKDEAEDKAERPRRRSRPAPSDDDAGGAAPDAAKPAGDAEKPAPAPEEPGKVGDATEKKTGDN